MVKQRKGKKRSDGASLQGQTNTNAKNSTTFKTKSEKKSASEAIGWHRVALLVVIILLAATVVIYITNQSRLSEDDHTPSESVSMRYTEIEIGSSASSDDHVTSESSSDKGKTPKVSSEETTSRQDDDELKRRQEGQDVDEKKTTKTTKQKGMKKRGAKKDSKVKKGKTKTQSQEASDRVLQSHIPASDQDSGIADDIMNADKLLEKRRTSDALKAFEQIVGKFPSSVRAHYGLAMSLDQLADEQRSNQLLTQSIKEYEKVWELSDLANPSDILRPAVDRLANRYAFMGQSGKAVMYLKRYLNQFSDDLPLMRELSIQYLLTGQNGKARHVLEQILKLRPNDGFAMGHLGFVVKSELDYEKAIPLLYGGLRGDDDRSREGRFYFHLGDALQRLGRRDEAYEVYQEATNNGIFTTPWQRSLYNAPNLKAQPWWKPSETPYVDSIRLLEANWKTIRDEGLSVMNRDTNAFEYEDENLRETGDWKQFTLFMRGSENKDTCSRVPKTCDIIRKIRQAAGNKRGQVKYSVMLPGTHVWPHTGPTNCRLRMHLGLVIPENVRIRVGNDTGTWEEGKIIIIDDSFEHEVWHEGSSMRLIFIVDFWHPDLSDQQKRTLSPI